ncbi:MAG: cation:proton antiporter [Bacteroidales bacterium]|nr:cation:proton antiporter [Bacteroidales bacterium]MCF8326743.1 cation:proton antiporter [Bacteroidales bacterium]
MINWFENNSVPILFIIGIIFLMPLVLSQLTKKLRLPNIIAYMVAGILLGPSVLNFLDEKTLSNMEFITHMVLGFVAFKIGLEVTIKEIMSKGRGIVITVLTESFLAVILVTLFLYILTGNLALALIFGALAPASAPAGTVAVIDETKSKGKLTRTLYSIVGIDDGLAIIIFGLISPLAIFLISNSGSTEIMDRNLWITFLEPFREIGLSIALGGLAAALFIGLTQIKGFREELLSLSFGTVLLVTGISELVNLSEILSGMVFGLIIGNLSKLKDIKEFEEEEIGFIIPLFYLLFFTIAGANLHLQSVPALGLIGLLYILARILGLGGGAFVGASLGGLETQVRKYVGFGILSQAGVAIGLALVIKNRFQGLGPEINDAGLTMGDHIGNIVFTTITATSVVFEILGPILTKYALKKSGEAQE